MQPDANEYTHAAVAARRHADDAHQRAVAARRRADDARRRAAAAREAAERATTEYARLAYQRVADLHVELAVSHDELARP